MRHRKGYRKIKRSTPHRLAFLKNITKEIVKHGKIETTIAKAKECRRFIEKIITIAKKQNQQSRRRVFSILQNKEMTEKMFKEIVGKYKERNGGYTRIVRTGIRKGDGAQKVIIELV